MKRSTFNQIKVRTHIIENGKTAKIFMKRQSVLEEEENSPQKQIIFEREIKGVRTGGKQIKNPIDYQARLKRGSIHRKHIQE